MPKVEWSKDNMRYVMCFFPLVGAVIGGVIYLWIRIADYLSMSHIFDTAIIVLLPLILTGGIHMDGFMDTTDALSSYQPREKKLEILKDPNSGAFAVIGCVGYYLLTYAVWYEVTKTELPVLAIGFILSRALSGLAVVTFPLAKNSGLAATFSNEAKKRLTRCVMIIFIILCAIGMLIINRKLGVIGMFAALLTFLHYYRISVKEFGGITGDLAGYFLQLCELIVAISVIIGGKV
jgi:adenosylcobinamide-GDP ribazoletransferase